MRFLLVDGGNPLLFQELVAAYRAVAPCDAAQVESVRQIIVVASHADTVHVVVDNRRGSAVGWRVICRLYTCSGIIIQRNGRNARVRGDNGTDAAVFVEEEAVDANLAVIARAVGTIILVDAVVDDVPFVTSRNLDNRVMSCAVNLLRGILL